MHIQKPELSLRRINSLKHTHYSDQCASSVGSMIRACKHRSPTRRAEFDQSVAVTIDKETGLMPTVGFEVVLIDNFLRLVISIDKYQISEPPRVGNSKWFI